MPFDTRPLLCWDFHHAEVVGEGHPLFVVTRASAKGFELKKENCAQFSMLLTMDALMLDPTVSQLLVLPFFWRVAR